MRYPQPLETPLPASQGHHQQSHTGYDSAPHALASSLGIHSWPSPSNLLNKLVGVEIRQGQ